MDIITNPAAVSRTLKYTRLFPESIAPTRGRDTDAGFDLCLRVETCTESGVVNLHLGIAVNIPPGFVGLLRPRSSVRNYNYSVASSCIIDAGYTGELILPLMRHEAFGPYRTRYYEIGDKCAQLVILPLPQFHLEPVDSLEETHRGSNGFGSTGR